MKNFNLIEMAKAMKEHKLRHMWRYAAMMALLLTLACGQMCGEDNTFSSSEIATNPTGGTKKGNVTCSSGITSTTKKKVKNTSNIYCVAIGNAVDTATYTVADWVQIQADANYTIDNTIVIQGAANGSDNKNIAVVMWRGAYSATSADTCFSAVAPENDSGTRDTIALRFPSGRFRTIRLYRRINYKNGVIGRDANGSTYQIPSSDASNFNIQSITATATAAVSCSDPTAPSAFAKTSVTSTTATFDITDAANAASYDIYCSESSTDPTSGTTPTATGITTKTPTITSLTSGTTYYAWVRAVCDASYKSSWVALGTTTFTTLTAPTASFSNSTYAIGGSALDLSSLWSSNSAGSVTYSVEDAAGTGASVSTAAFSATRAGKAKVKAVQAANGSYDAITKYAYITVGSNVEGKHTVTFDLEVNVNKSRIPVTDSVRSTSLYLTTAEGDTLKGTGLSYDGGAKSGLTGKIQALASYDGDKYVYVQFSIADGYTFTLDSAWCVVQAVGKGKNQNGKLVISDSNSHSFTGSEISCPGTDAGTQTHVVVKGDGSTAFTGTVTLKIYVYGTAATYRLGEKINIHGSLAAVEETCPDAYSFTYKNTSTEWSDPVCFTNTETSDGNSGNFWIAECTLPTDGVSFKLGWEGKDDAENAKTTEVDFQYMPYELQRTKTFGVHPTSSNTGGAEGYLRVRSSYGDNNKYIGFIPAGYVLRTGSGESWSSTNFVPASEDYFETSWSTPLTALSSSTAAKHYYVGLKTSSGYVWSNAYSEDWSRLIFLYPKGSASSGWRKDGAKMQLHYWKDGGGGADAYVTMTDDDGDGVYEAWLPNASYDRVQFKRMSSDMTSEWNKTGDLELQSDKNVYIIEEDFSQTGWDVYEQSGKFNIYANSNDKNWYLRFKPHYVLTYDANGGSSTMDKQSVAIDALSKSVTVASNGFTAPTGYTFAGWNPDEDDADAGTIDGDYDPSDNVTLSADMTLYAVWSPKTCTVSFDNNGGTGTITSVTATYDAAMPTKAGNLPEKTGYTFAGFWDGEGGTGNQYYKADGTSNANWDKNTTSATTLYAKWTANTPTITLDDQDATNTPTGSVVATYGSSMPEITTLPTKTGYTFGGFYSDVAGGGTQYYTNTGASAKNSDLASATTLYALWTQSVTLDDNNGGEHNGSVSVTYKGTAGTPSAPTYAGHTPDLGYYAESSCTNKVMALDGTLQTSVTDGSSVVWTNSSSKWAHAGASTLYAHWKCNTPTITDNGDNTVTITVPAGTTVYYTTDETTPSSSNGTEYTDAFDIAEDVTVKAIAIQDDCTDSEVASVECKYVVSGTNYYLFTPTSAPVHGGVLSGEFVTDASKQDQEKTILGYTFPSYLKGIGTATSMSSRVAGSQGVQYYAKTSNTKFIIYYGVSSSSGTYSIHIGRVSEGETSVTSVSRSVSANDLDTIQYSYTNSKNTTFSFHINNNNIWIYQIVVIESGTDHKQAGEAGYDLSFNKGRIALKSDKTITAEGLTIKSGSSFSYTNSTALSMAKNDFTNNQISFTTPASPGDLKLTWSGGQMALNTSASADGATNVTSGTAYSLSGSTKYYLINTGGSASSVTKLQFVAAATTHSVTVAYNGSGSYGTAAAASTTVGEGSTTTITATPETGYQVTNWAVSGTGSTISPSGASNSNTTTLTMGTDDATVTCTFGAINYTLSWSSNGGSDLSGSYTSGSTAYGAAITAPEDPTLSNYTFDGWNTANDGSGTDKGSTMPAANTTYYAAWKQTVTLTTGAQGSGSNQTPVVYLNGTGVSSFTAHTASGYTLQGYYTAGSGGTKVLNADGTFASSNVTDYITSSKWSRTGAAPTLYAQWVASEDCSTSDFVIKKGSDTQYQGCMESSSYDGTATSFTAGSATTVGNAKMTISSYSKGAITRPGSGNTFSIVIEPVSGYYLKSICWAGKVEDDETVSYYWDNNSGSATTITPQTTSGTGVTYNAPNSTTTKFTASYVDDGDGSGGIWWRNVQVEVCAAGGTKYSVTYDGNDKTSGDVPTDATAYSYGGTVTVLDNTEELAKTNYTFAGWATKDDGTGTNYVADNTFSIANNTTLYAKWTQGVTFDANTANHGSTGGSATAVWNAKGLTSITHAKPASGYKLSGYYTEATSGTKVLNSDGTFAASNVTDYITDGKWSRTGTAATLYAQYESAGALTWNLVVKSDTSALSTSTKTSAFTEIAVANMTNAALTGLTYSKSSKSSLTGKISTPASEDASKYVSVSFQVAAGYKFTPSSIKVKVQPISADQYVKLELKDNAGTPNSITYTTASKQAKGSISTVEMTNGSSVEFTGTVTLKILCYGTAYDTDGYRLGTPITIEGEIEEACGTMPSYTSMSYTTTTFAPSADASGSPITIVGGTNVNTYKWKYNTVNDRTSGTDCGTNSASLTPLTDEDAATDGTRYYWCEMTNTSCGITIKSPAVAITVAAEKSDATVTWADPASTPNYGGGGYTIKATVDQTGWDGNAADLVITAPAGINIYNVTSGTTSSQKWVQVNFDVQTSFDRSTYASNIPFTVSAAATASYNAISNDHNVSYSACAGAGEGSSYNIRVRKAYTKGGPGNNYYYWDNTDGWISSPNPASSIGSAKASSPMATVFDSVSNTNAEAVYVRTYHNNIKKVRIYADFRANNMTVSNVYKHNDFYTANSKYAVDYSVVYNGDEENEDLGTAAQGYVDITLSDVMMSANDILLVKFNTSRVRPLGAVITESSAGSINTGLTWSSGTADGGSVTGKTQSSANFTITATRDAAAAVSLGAITYSSSNTSCATVNATTGEVTITASGESALSTTIKATLAASGCYKKKEITYTLTIPGVTCTIERGTLTSDVTSKCSSENATLTLTDFESGAIVQWYKGETTISTGGDYTITTDGTTSTLVTAVAGTYSVMVTNSAGTCSDRSNSITITNVSAEASVTKIVDEWYVKNGRLTPDIALWTMSEGATLKSVAWSSSNATGLTCYASDGIIYLQGKSPSSNDSGADIEYTLTATITDECNTDHEETTKTIKITHQKNTDKHVLAFVVEGTAKGGFTAGITAAQTTNVDLYNTIAANFDVLATNIYSTDDEKKLKEYYSQFDILCITDYPNTKTKGVNSKSYVDAMGALVDIRPILTMEAWVSGLANWKAKGISGTPKSPTTRQYTMLLQCKDHEIFSGTELTKVGEGDETMYRISMVCDTLEDYKTLDATYGSGTHESDKNYQYGKKPALQGFTFDATMADDGLLPIGRIDDGSGNDLEVGVERQTEMEARLMVLGINSYAMERLTDDGQTVVVNALKYLMKKNSEDIADCSNTFVGGDDEEDESTRYDWNVDSHWSGNAVPERTQKVRIVAPCVIKADEKFHVTGVVIAPSGKYNHGANTANGSLTIAAGGALIVDGKVEAATAPLYTETRATTPTDLILMTNSTAQSALIFDNSDGETQATVVVHSSANKDGSTRNWQYLTSPLQETPVTEFFYGVGTYTYKHSEADGGWVRYNLGTAFNAFDAIGLTQEAAKDFVFYGPLAPTGEWNLSLTHAHSGNNLFGNSWTAPIDLKALVNNTDFDSNIELDLAIYNTGADKKNGEGEFDQEENADNTPGTWHHIPLYLATLEDAGWEGMTVIPAYQAFQLKATAAATLTIDYDKCVRGSESKNYTEPLRSPGHRAAGKSNSDIEALRLAVSDAKGIAYIYLLEGEQFSEEYDNGWELEYKPNSKYGKLYAISPEQGDMMALARPYLEGTMVGFQPGESSEYTITFNETDGYYYLNDLKMEQSTLIQAGESYTFSVEEGESANRFLISSVPFNKPGIVTGVTNPNAEAPKAQKVIYNDKLYIIRGGKVFSADGQLVK